MPIEDETIGDQAMSETTAAHKLDPGFLKVLERSEIDADDFFAGMGEAAELGITKEQRPGQVHSLKHLMMPALSRVGLITERTRELFEAADIQLNEDMTVLQAMQDQKSNQNILHAAGASY